MNELPTEILTQILVKIDPTTIYNLLLTSQFFVEILDTEKYWEIRIDNDTILHSFVHKTNKWLYQCHLRRKVFKHDLSETPWENEQSEKVFVGEEEGYIIYTEPNKKIIKEIVATLRSVQNIEEENRRLITAAKIGYCVYSKIDDNIYFFRYAPYDALYVGVMFNTGNIFIDVSQFYVGEIVDELFRNGYGSVIFQSGFILTRENWTDVSTFIVNDNPRLNTPVRTIESFATLEEGLEAWIQFCVENDLNDEWAMGID